MLNLTSAWWMRATEHIAPNALLAVPDPNVAIMRACAVFPVEFVVRGFMTGAGQYLRSALAPCALIPARRLPRVLTQSHAWCLP